MRRPWPTGDRRAATEEEYNIHLLYFRILIYSLDFCLVSASESPVFVNLIFELPKVVSL